MSAPPRPFTQEEMRKKVLSHLLGIAHYWADLPVKEMCLQPGDTENRYRAEGIMHSILAMLDGCSVGMPGFDLVAHAHPSDAEYARDEGENWWPNSTTVEVSHDDWGTYRREMKG